MTDRVGTITLVLDKDIRVDDVQPLLDACHQLKGVIAVKANVSDYNGVMAYSRARHELTMKLFDALREDK
jgi:hypothetical protein